MSIRSGQYRFLQRLGIALGGLLLPLGAALGQVGVDLSDLQAGQTVVNLSETAEVSVEQDTLNAVLQYSAQGRDRPMLQDDVNRAMTEAREILEDYDTVNSSIAQYHVYLVQRGGGTPREISNPVWRAQQNVSLDATDTAALLDLVGELQGAGLHVTGLYYSLSPGLQKETTDGLLAAALEALQGKADEVAGILGKREAQLIEVNVNGGGGMQPRMYAMQAREMDAAMVQTPVAEPGETQVSLTVSATALLSP